MVEKPKGSETKGFSEDTLKRAKEIFKKALEFVKIRDADKNLKAHEVSINLEDDNSMDLKLILLAENEAKLMIRNECIIYGRINPIAITKIHIRGGSRVELFPAAKNEKNNSAILENEVIAALNQMIEGFRLKVVATYH